MLHWRAKELNCARGFYIRNVVGAIEEESVDCEEWQVDWAFLDKQHAMRCVEEDFGAVVIDCAMVDSTIQLSPFF